MNENIGRQARRRAIVRSSWIAALAVGFVLGAGHALLDDLAITLPLGLLTVGAGVLFLAAVVASILYWRNIDEAAREAHKFAWFWGGSSGVLFPLPLVLLMGDARLVALMGQHSPSEWVGIGVIGLLTMQLIGYGIVWAAWWLRQR